MLGIGIGLAFAAMANLIVETVPAEQTGVATGMNTVMRTIGGAVGSQVAAEIVAATATTERPTDAGASRSPSQPPPRARVSFFVALAVPGAGRVWYGRARGREA